LIFLHVVTKRIVPLAERITEKYCIGGLERREIILYEANPMSGVFQNIDPPPPHPPASVYPPPPPLVRGEDTLAGWRGGGGSICCKTPDTALYST
jgi:hypothetical protein